MPPWEDSFAWSFNASNDSYYLANKPWLILPTDKSIGDHKLKELVAKFCTSSILKTSKFLHIMSNNAVKIFRKIVCLFTVFENCFCYEITRKTQKNLRFLVLFLF